MKKSIILLAAISMCFLAGCGETNSASPSTGGESSSLVTSDVKVKVRGESAVMVGKTTSLTVTISNDSTNAGFDATINDATIASLEIENKTITVTGLKVGDAKITVVSKADSNASAVFDISVTAVSNPTVTITAEKNLVVQNSSLNLTAAVTDYLGTASFTWRSLNSKGTFTGDKGAATTTYKANVPGSDVIEASFNIGEEKFSATINITVLADHTGWTSLKTADDIKNNLLKDGSIDGNYFLENDIDLDGYVLPYNGRTLVGALDGQGYSIKNFEVTGLESDAKSNGGFFHEIGVGGVVMNIGFTDVIIGEAGSGWGTSVLCCACSGELENISVSVKHTFDNSALMDAAEWFPFNSAFVGIFKENSSYKNIVVNVDTDPEGGYNTIFADVAYPAGGSQGLSAQGVQSFTVDGFYTNSNVIGGSVWEWGSPVEDQSTYHSGLDWATSAVSTYDDLDANIWNITQGQMPSLKDLAV